jgi:hypothetical protein
MSIDEINRRLEAINPHYAAKFVAAEDGSVDDGIAVTLAGATTRWALQIGSGYVAVNEYGEDAAGEFWMRDHGMYRSKEQAVERLCELLSEAAASR